MDQDLSGLAHAAVGGVVFLQHGLGLDHQVVLEGRHRLVRMGLDQPLHPVQGPEEVHRGGPGRGDFPADGFETADWNSPGVIGLDLQGPQGRAHGRGHPDGRRPPDGQRPDGLDDLAIIPDLQINLFRGAAAADPSSLTLSISQQMLQ